MAASSPKRSLELARGPSPRQPGLSVVIPMFNEADNLARLLAELRAALDPLGLDYELVFVDDASRDESVNLLRPELGDRIRCVCLAENRGQSVAMEVGLRAARYDRVVLMDADLQNDPADIPKLLERLEYFDAAYGVRAKRKDTAWKRFSSRVANRLRGRLLGDQSSDTGCTLKAFRGEVVDRLTLFRGMHRFIPALVKMEGFTACELPVNHRDRHAGVTKYGTFDRLKQSLPDLFGVLWLKSRYADFTAREVQ
ncbi:MAG: glycosyltransferase family 2 protein [Vulcanimicrobiota bacterium]